MFYLVTFFILGLLVGSFLNVLVLRLGTGRSIVAGRSMCLTCGKPLAWYELLPLVSYLLQAGRCRACKTRISLLYPLVEATTALLFAGSFVVYHAFVSWPLLALLLVIESILVAIAAYDIRHTIIPDRLVYPFIVLSAAAHYLLFGGFAIRTLDFWAGPIFFAAFALLWLLSRGKWMGFGDAKLVLGLGFLLGWHIGISALLVAFWLGAAVGIVLLFAKRGRITMQSEIPFAPFLIVGILSGLLTNIQLF